MILHELFEAHDPLTPGKKRALELNLADLLEKYASVKQYHDQLASFLNEIPPGMEQELADLEKEYKAAIQQEVENIKKYTNESKISKFVKGLEKKCSDAISDMRKAEKFLYRGTRQFKDAYISRPHTARSTMSSYSEMQELYDQKISEVGFKALRSNSIFTTSNLRFAKNFGTHIYLIFPVNGFSFTWSETEDDIILKSEKLRSWINMDLVKSLWSEIVDNEKNKRIFIRLSRLSYMDPDSFNLDTEFTDRDISTLESYYLYLNENRILEYDGFLGSEYRDYEITALKKMKKHGLIQDKNNIVDSLDSSLSSLISGQTIVDNMKLRNTGFYEALQSGHEITINSLYYAISIDYIDNVDEILKITDKYRKPNWTADDEETYKQLTLADF